MAKPTKPKLYWHKFEWGDLANKTMHFTQGQMGAYILFLHYLYSCDNEIYHEDRHIIARANNEDQKANADFVLDKFFQRTKTGWLNHEVAENKEAGITAYLSRAENGRKGGQRKAQNNKLRLDQGELDNSANLALAELEPNQSSDIAITSTITSIETLKESQEQSPLSQNMQPLPPRVKTLGDGIRKLIDGQFDVRHHLMEDDHAQIRKIAPGWNIDYLAEIFNGWINDNPEKQPRHPAKAFMACIPSYTKNNKP